MLVLFNVGNLITLFIKVTETAKILTVFPAPFISHQVVFRPFTQELARRGHEVTVITPDPAFPKGETPANLTEINVHDISYELLADKIKSISKTDKESFLDNVRMFVDLAYLLIVAQFSHKEIQNLIKDKNAKFDLLILEGCARPALMYSLIYKVPIIQMSSFGASYGNFEAVGAPIHPFLYPSVNRKKNFNLSLWEKMIVIYNEYQIASINNEYEEHEDALIRKYFGSDSPSVKDLKNNIDMLFLNVHPIFEGIRPVPPSVVFMGGLHQTPDKELPVNVKSLLDASKQGVIYISFGTNVDTTLLDAEKVRILVRVFSQLPYVVFWKWDAKELPGCPDNVKINTWWPQSDLLKHPNVKLFITQGGLQSTDEAITAGVPLIGMPIFGDQWLNVERYEYHKIGVKLEIKKLTEEDLRDAINTVISDDIYRRNIVQLRDKMYDQPQSPLERAVWWTEHVLRHGGARHLRAPAANMPWTEYLELELVLTILLVLTTITFVCLLSIIFVWKKFTAKYFGKSKVKRD